MENEKIRLQKFLAQSGVASRRKAEKYIADGLVRVNGTVASLGDKVDIKNDRVTFKNKRINCRFRHIYLALNKPRGYLSAVSDDRGGKCVTELLNDVKERIYPVGRLDKNSEGLLIMTNDGDFANAVTHPSHHISKVYRVTVDKKPTKAQIDILGSQLEIDGKATIPAKVRILKSENDRTVLEIVLFQGINRQIRKMCEQVGLVVKRLTRVAVGKVELSGLKPGAYRSLTQTEVKSFRE